MTLDPRAAHTGTQRGARAGGGRPLRSVIGLSIGILLLTGLIGTVGFDPIRSALSHGGWGLFSLIVLYPLELYPRALAWRWVYPGTCTARHGPFIEAMWIGQSLNRLIPTAGIGGDIARGRLLVLRGAPTDAVIASLVADKAAQAMSTWLLMVLGLLLIMGRAGDPVLAITLAAAALLLLIAIGLFLRLQHGAGVSKMLTRWSGGTGGRLARLTPSVRAIEGLLATIYARRGRLVASTTVRTAGVVAMAAELWLAAWLLHIPLSPLDAITLRVVGFAVRSLAFMVWGGIGVQEGAFLLLSSVTGVAPAGLIALSLATRFRELLVALPAMGLWLRAEHRFQPSERSGREG